MHLLILAATFAAGPLLASVVRRHPGLARPVRWSLALVSTALGLTWYLYRGLVLHTRWGLALPLEVCDLALWITVAALLRPTPLRIELSWFWGVAGATVALATPYLTAPLLSVPSITFLAGHAIIVVNALFLLGTFRLRPRRGAWLRATLLLYLLVAVDFIADRLLPANYMYLLQKPPIRSALDLMGPWPWYILVAAAVAALVFWLMQLPFRFPPPINRGSPPPAPPKTAPPGHPAA